MANLYENIEKLCKQRGVNVTTMCKESGASRGSLTDLKNGRKQTLKYETLDKIASYFGTSVDALVSGNQKENPPQQPQSEVDAAVERIRRKLESMPKEQREALMLFPAHAGVIQGSCRNGFRPRTFPRPRGGSTLTTLRKKQIIGLS